MLDSDAETRYCSGCQQDKPLDQFLVTETSHDGSAYQRKRKWCHACCEASSERQSRSAQQNVRSMARVAKRLDEQRAEEARKLEKRIASDRAKSFMRVTRSDEGGGVDRVHDIGAALWLLANAGMSPTEWTAAVNGLGWIMPRNKRRLIEGSRAWISELKQELFGDK